MTKTRLTRVAASLVALVTSAILASVGFSLLSSGADNLSPSGRLQITISADAYDPTTGKGFGFERICEADAIALMDENGTIEDIREVGANPVRRGENVESLSNDRSYGPVYRDSSGQLHEGCAPDSPVTTAVP